MALRQYPSPEGGTDTIGWGHKLKPGEGYPRGIDLASAQRMFDADSIAHLKIVRNSVKVPLTQNQFDALASLSYNVPSAFASERTSTLLRKLNSGDYSGAADQILRWNKATDPKTNTKVVLPGLTARREAERNIFLYGTYVNHK